MIMGPSYNHATAVRPRPDRDSITRWGGGSAGFTNMGHCLINPHTGLTVDSCLLPNSKSHNTKTKTTIKKSGHEKL